MLLDTVSILDGNRFVVSNRRGDIEATPTDNHGLFLDDTRYLSRWILTIDGMRPAVLSVDDQAYYQVVYFLALATGTVYVDSQLTVVRKRWVAVGFQEDLTLANHARKPVDLEVRLEAGADFADLFEVKDKLNKKGELYREVAGDRQLTLGYRRERFCRETHITSSAHAEFSEEGLQFKVHLEPQGQWSTCLDVSAVRRPRVNAKPQRPRKPRLDSEHRSELAKSLHRWLEEAPTVSAAWQPLEHIFRRSLVDLAALRFRTPLLSGALPAAGLPWFMSIFGRDSLLTSFQSLPFIPELTRTTLKTLASLQCHRDDPFRDAEPGKIVHELRLGELTAFEEAPHSPYYGSADATPLFLVVLEEYERWSGDAELVRSLESAARAAIDWIDHHGDRDGDGYIEYERRSPKGLENHCWKDSWDSIAFADGSIAVTPRATCELQGYAYDAKLRAARLAREIWNDPAWAATLEQQAADLKRRFNRDFWIPERGFFALGLDGEKRKIDSLTSNIGHLLWSGIADEDKAGSCVRHLMSDALFSGWGIRTMANGEASYNPIGYHVGTVWPHDTSFIAWGLRRYGYRAEAARLASGVLEAAEFFNFRLPEAFGGYSRQITRYPVEYPTACSPQAWATGAPLLMLRTLLGLESDGKHLIVDPAVPQTIGRLELLDLPGRWGRMDAFGRARKAA